MASGATLPRCHATSSRRLGSRDEACDVSLMNQLCINSQPEHISYPTGIAAWWELLARELAEEWCGRDSDDEGALSQEAGNPSLRDRDV